VLTFDELDSFVRAVSSLQAAQAGEKVVTVRMETCHGFDTLIILLSAEDTNGPLQADLQLSDCDRVPHWLLGQKNQNPGYQP